jgi:hypothetical protein
VAVLSKIWRTATPVVAAQARWRRSSLTETDASDLVSAACYRLLKHVRIHPVIVTELKLRDVERHVFCAHFVERADHAAFEDRPEAFNRVRVNRADHVLLYLVAHGFERIFRQAVIDLMIVGREQANLVRNHFTHKRFNVALRYVVQHASDHVSLALDRADDRGFASACATALAGFLVPMAVVVFAADPRLVNLDYAAKLLLRRDQRSADFVAHGMGRLVATEAHHALDLEGAHSLLARQHEMGDAEPVAERLLSVLENRATEAREPITLRRTGPALPMKGLIAGGVVEIDVAASRASHALRPPTGDQVAKAGFVIPDWKTGLELGRGHLRNWLRTFCHDAYPFNLTMERYCHG